MALSVTTVTTALQVLVGHVIRVSSGVLQLLQVWSLICYYLMALGDHILDDGWEEIGAVLAFCNHLRRKQGEGGSMRYMYMEISIRRVPTKIDLNAMLHAHVTGKTYRNKATL